MGVRIKDTYVEEARRCAGRSGVVCGGRGGEEGGGGIKEAATCETLKGHTVVSAACRAPEVDDDTREYGVSEEWTGA